MSDIEAADLVAAWRAEAARLEAWGASAQATTLLHAAEELKALVDASVPSVARETGQGSPDARTSCSSWRDRLWTVPPGTRLGVREVAEALGRSADYVYRHTAPGGTTRRLPHRKLDGELVFLAGELRDWLGSAEAVVEPAVRRLHATR